MIVIFKQVFDQKSSTFTYLIASSKGREALIIDPVLENVEDYIKLLEVLKLVGPLATRQEISDCLMINPKLNDINSFRNKEWKKNQDDKSFK